MKMVYRNCSMMFLSCAVLLSILTGCSRHSANSVMPAEGVAKVSAEMQRVGIMSPSEYRKVLDFQHEVEGGGHLSESEVDWLLSLANRAGTVPQQAARSLQVIMVFADGQRSSLPATRLEDVFNFAVRAAKHTGNPEALPLFGCIILGKLQDTRAIPDLTLLLSSDDGNVRREARKALHTLRRPTE